MGVGVSRREALK